MPQYRKAIHLKIWALLVSLSVVFLVEAQVYRFDFGALSSTSYIPVLPDYNSTLFSWTKAPSRTFEQVKYSTWREDPWLDGVVGGELAFELELPNGNYEVQLFLSAGLEVTSTWKLNINDRDVRADLHPVRNNPEPDEVINPHVKIWTGPCLISDEILKIHLKGTKDSIRLLALHVFSKPNNLLLDRNQKWLLDMMQSYGKLKHHPRSLKPLMDNLQTRVEAFPQDAWAAKYLQETTWLNWAEHFVKVRGWQWSTNLYRLSMIKKFQQGAMFLNPIVKQPSHPLYERALWLFGRILYHLDAEYLHDPDRLTAQQCFSELLEIYPEDTLIQMYSGIQIRNRPDHIQLYADAPEWSKAQALAMHRLRRLVHYWVLERQAPNGEMGGKYGDDVEALRFWLPLFYTGDSVAIQGLTRIADGVWHSDEIRNGFARHISDVEHASEFISDTAPLLIASTDDQQKHDRALPTAHLMDTLWTMRDRDGNLFFRSSWYSSSAYDERPPRNRDVPMNTRSAKVMRYYLWRYPDHDHVKGLLHEWTKSWVGLSRRTDKGKPFGILPASYDPHNASINGNEPNWYEANMYWPYYDFNGDVMMLDQMLFLSQYTTDTTLLNPVEWTIELVDRHHQADGPPGSPAWAANQFFHNEGFHSLVGSWRLLTRNQTYDDFLSKYGAPYLRYRINNDMQALLDGLQEFNDQLAYNWPMQTTDAWFTDRIHATGPNAQGRVNSDLLKAMLTGDMNRNGTSPYMAVTWENLVPGITALVQESTSRNLEIIIFSHTKGNQEIVLRLWNLKPGPYEVRLDQGRTQSFVQAKPGQRLNLLIQPNKTYHLTLKARTE